MKQLVVSFIFIAILTSCTSDGSSDQLAIFQHGVASGDPLQDRVVIWTRVTAPGNQESIEVDWEFATDSLFERIIKYGKFTTGPDRDFTVKMDISGLNPGTKYYYRFKSLGETSMIGRTKTASQVTNEIKLAIVSCSNYEWGYFNAYKRIAERKDLDAVLHLGDYIYEYGTRQYRDSTISRFVQPEHEIVSLEDYRTRYAHYRTDPDLQAVHAAHPFITIWDDHEIANDSYVDGAQNHQQEEGDYIQRKGIARKVYYEWLPVREDEKLYRKISYGSLMDLVMLDERLEGRTKQLDSLQDPRFNDPSRSMLGEEQLAWFKNTLLSSQAKWKVIGNQVIYSDLRSASGGRNLDSWEGYPIEKQKIARFFIDEKIKNAVWVTGDTHTSWAFETMVEPVSEEPFAVEFGATSVNSGNWGDGKTSEQVAEREKGILENNPHLKYTNQKDHGYLLLTIKPDQVKADFMFVETNKVRSDKEVLGYSAIVRSGTSRISQ